MLMLKIAGGIILAAIALRAAPFVLKWTWLFAPALVMGAGGLVGAVAGWSLISHQATLSELWPALLLAFALGVGGELWAERRGV